MEEITIDAVSHWLKPRPIDSHKGSFGSVLVLGGDYGMPGAVRLVAEGALRSGAGLVSVVTRKAHISAVVCGRPELLCYGIEESLDILDVLLERATVIAIGSGLGQSAWSKKIFNKVINSSMPLVIDADALNLLAETKQIPKNSTNWILTPHPGEAARLLGISTSDVQDSREKNILLLQQKYAATVVLKGSKTLIAGHDKQLQYCRFGNPGMASAGMGDLLGGIIVGLLAQGLTPSQAAEAGVLYHAIAGDIAIKKRGSHCVLAMDVLDELRL
jgi:ADP-dependent NAD(P)H-hydrate dehydratase / NAD(P)H-hydrate epimerase